MIDGLLIKIIHLMIVHESVCAINWDHIVSMASKICYDVLLCKVKRGVLQMTAIILRL